MCRQQYREIRRTAHGVCLLLSVPEFQTASLPAGERRGNCGLFGHLPMLASCKARSSAVSVAVQAALECRPNSEHATASPGYKLKRSSAARD